MMEPSECKTDDFYQVGTTIYKDYWEPCVNGTFIRKSRISNRSEFTNLFGKEALCLMRRYDSFCCIPSHTDYRRDIGTCLNKYAPLLHTPSPGRFDTIMQFLEHIFQEQLEYGLDYLELLYLFPEKKLPILVLLSKERGTGKTTFLNFLKEIFGDNMTFNTNEDFRSNFNSGWAGKLLIAVDEAFLNKKEDAEHLKTLSTAKTFKMEAKGVDRIEIAFHGKFILCSNKLDDAIYIEPEENRYWVRKIEVLPHSSPNFLDKIKSEIPHFLYFLSNRKLTTEEVSRMWFDMSALETKALKRLKHSSRNPIETNLAEILIETLDSSGCESLCYTMSDLIDLMHSNRFNYSRQEISRVVQKNWNLKDAGNSLSYSKYYSESPNPYFSKEKGRYYEFSRSMLDKIINI